MGAPILGFLRFGVGLIGVLWLAFAGGYLVWEYDRLPAGWPNYHVKCCLVVHWTLKLPDSLGAQLAALRAADAAAARHAHQVAQRQDAITAQAQTQAVQIRTQIRWRTQTLIQQVHDVITPETDRRYPLPVGFVRLYDASLLGRQLSAVPDPLGRADDAPSAITASAAGAGIAANNGECLVDRARLIGLQDWVTQQIGAQR